MYQISVNKLNKKASQIEFRIHFKWTEKAKAQNKDKKKDIFTKNIQKRKKKNRIDVIYYSFQASSRLPIDACLKEDCKYSFTFIFCGAVDPTSFSNPKSLFQTDWRYFPISLFFLISNATLFSFLSLPSVKSIFSSWQRIVFLFHLFHCFFYCGPFMDFSLFLISYGFLSSSGCPFRFSCRTSN